MHIIRARPIIKTLVSLSLILSILNLVGTIDADPVTKRFEVNVQNQLLSVNNSLPVRGQRSRGSNAFCESISDMHQNIFKKTLQFWWNAKQQTLDVLNKRLGDGDCQSGIGGNVCSWIVKSDGFYFCPNRVGTAAPIGTIQKRFDWL